MFPTEIIATVLFAVQISITATSMPITASAPLLPFMREDIDSIMYSIPPLFFTISNHPPASIVTIMSLPMDIIPSPIY